MGNRFARAGESVKLRDLLDEAEARALQIVREKSPDLGEEQQRDIARVVGLGAVKYADLAQNRTGLRLLMGQNAGHAGQHRALFAICLRVWIRSIFRRASAEDSGEENSIAHDTSAHNSTTLTLEHPAELELAKFILRFPLAIETALSDYRLNALPDYLFDWRRSSPVSTMPARFSKSEEPLRPAVWRCAN